MENNKSDLSSKNNANVDPNSIFLKFFSEKFQDLEFKDLRLKEDMAQWERIHLGHVAWELISNSTKKEKEQSLISLERLIRGYM